VLLSRPLLPCHFLSRSHLVSLSPSLSPTLPLSPLYPQGTGSLLIAATQEGNLHATDLRAKGEAFALRSLSRSLSSSLSPFSPPPHSLSFSLSLSLSHTLTRYLAPRLIRTNTCVCARARVRVFK